MENFNSKIPLRFGAICFAAVIALGLVMYIFYEALASNFLLYIAISLGMLSMGIFLGVRSAVVSRQERGGLISFGHAFGAIYIVFVLYILGGTASQLLVTKVIDREYPAKLSNIIKQKMEDRFEKMNMSDEDTRKALQNMNPENFDPPMEKILKGLGISLAVAAVIAAIIAVFIRKTPADLADANPGM